MTTLLITSTVLAVITVATFTICAALRAGADHDARMRKLKHNGKGEPR